MTEKLIFVSCGQLTTEEINMGTAINNFIDSKPGFKAYFAEYVQNLDALAKNIFEGLRTCSGLISFMHERGVVKKSDGKNWGYRSSVWVNQEIGILAYRKHFEGGEIPILVFKDERVRLEGAMTSLIVNPKPIKSENEVKAEIDSWLNSNSFPNRGVNDDRFHFKWEKLSSTSLKVLSALLDEGGDNVKESAVKSCLRENYGMTKDKSSTAVSDAKLEFANTDLVKLIHDINSGDEMSINPVWRWYISRKLSEFNS